MDLWFMYTPTVTCTFKVKSISLKIKVVVQVLFVKLQGQTPFMIFLH